MDELISIYRLVDGVQTTVCSISKENASLNQGIMDKDIVTLPVGGINSLKNVRK